MKYVVVTAHVKYCNGYTAVECFTVPLDELHRFELNVSIKSAGQISVLEILKVEPCEC